MKIGGTAGAAYFHCSSDIFTMNLPCCPCNSTYRGVTRNELG